MPTPFSVVRELHAGSTEEPTEVEESPNGRYIRYNILLGRGACKRVYKALDTEEGTEVAWNQVDLLGMDEDEEARTHLFEEIRVLQQLKHKNIMTFHAWWYDKYHRHVNFITELFSGNLRQYRKKLKLMSENVLKRWAYQILEGLLYLHGHVPPIVHRDLKCDNIFVNSVTGEIKIGDLGLATVQQQGMSVVGTPEFMAPEVYEESYDEKCDIYSFGMCVLELATLEYPYAECHSVPQIFKKVTTGVPPASLSRITSPELHAFISLCIQHEPEARPSARELLKHPYLEAIRAGGDVSHHSGVGAGSPAASSMNLATGAPSSGWNTPSGTMHGGALSKRDLREALHAQEAFARQQHAASCSPPCGLANLALEQRRSSFTNLAPLLLRSPSAGPASVTGAAGCTAQPSPLGREKSCSPSVAGHGGATGATSPGKGDSPTAAAAAAAGAGATASWHSSVAVTPTSIQGTATHMNGSSSSCPVGTTAATAVSPFSASAHPPAALPPINTSQLGMFPGAPLVASPGRRRQSQGGLSRLLNASSPYPPESSGELQLAEDGLRTAARGSRRNMRGSSSGSGSGCVGSGEDSDQEVLVPIALLKESLLEEGFVDTPTHASAASLAFAMALHDSADDNLCFTAPSALTLMDPSIAGSATASASAAAAAALAAGQDPDEAALRAFADAMHGAAAAAAPPPSNGGPTRLVAALDTAVRRVAAAAMEALRHSDSTESLDLDPEIQRSKASSRKALAAVAMAAAAGAQQAHEVARGGDEAGSGGEGREQGGGAKAHTTAAQLQGPNGSVVLLPVSGEASLRIPLIHTRSGTALCTASGAAAAAPAMGGVGASAGVYGTLPLPPAGSPGSGPATPPRIPHQRATYHGPQTLTVDVSQGPHAPTPLPAATPGYRLPSFRNRVVVAMSTDVAADSPKRLPGAASLGGAPSLGGGASTLVSCPSVASAAPNSQTDSPTAAAEMRRTFVRTSSSNFSRSCFGSEFAAASSGWRSSMMANGSPRASAGSKVDSSSLPSGSCSGSRSLSQSHAQVTTATRFRTHPDGTGPSPGNGPNRASAPGEQHPASELLPLPSHKHTNSSGAALDSVPVLSVPVLSVPIGPLGASSKSRSSASPGNSQPSTAPGEATSPPRPAVSPFLEQCHIEAASTPPAAARALGSFRGGSGSPAAAGSRSRSTSRERSPPIRDLKHVGDSGLLNALGCCDVPLVFRNAAGASTIGAPPGMELNGGSPRVSGSGSASEGEGREAPWEGAVESAVVQRVPSRAAYLPTLEEDVEEYDSGSPTGVAAAAAVVVQRVGEEGEAALAVGVALGPQLAVVHVAPLPDTACVHGAEAAGAGAGSYVVVHEFARPIQGVVMRLKQLRRLVKNRLHGKGKSNGGVSSKEPSTSGMAAGVAAAE